MTRVETILMMYHPPRILLGLKSFDKKFGGRWNGFGEGVENGESLEECARRETLDETGIIVNNLEKRGEILFQFKINEQDHEVHIYNGNSYKGKPKVTDDFVGYALFHKDYLPVDKMMPADKYWLPFFVQNKFFIGKICFGEGFKVVSYEINEVNSL